MKRLLLITAAFFILSLALLTFLLGSGPGLQIMLSVASSLSGNGVSVEMSRGRALGDFRLEGLSIVTAAAEVSIAELDWQWRPAALFRGQLHIGDVSAKGLRVNLQQTGPETGSAGGPLLLPDLSLPLSFLLGRISVEDLQVHDEKGAELVRIDRLSSSISGSADHLQIGELTLRTRDYGITVHGTLQLSSGWPLDLNGNWWAELPECNKLQGAVALAGGLAEPQLVVSLLQPQRLEVKGSFRGLFDTPSGTVEGQGKNLDLIKICSDWPAANVDLSFTSSGSIADYRGHLETSLTYANESPIQLATDFAGDETGITVDSARIKSRGNQMELSGRIGWLENLSWNASLSLHAFDLSVYKDLPRLLLDADILSEGQLTQDGLRYQVSTSTLEGTLAAPQLSFSGALQLAGDLEHVQVSNSKLHVGDGMLTINGGLDWSSGLAWETHVLLQAVDPSIFPNFPAGRVNGDISTSGSLDGDKRSFEAVIDSMSGTLAGYDLEGAGRIGYRDGQFNARNLYIKNGTNLIQVEGIVDDSFGLDFKIAAPELHLLYPRLKGNIQLTGQLGGTQEHPVLTVSGDGQKFSFQDYRLDALKLKARVELSEGGRLETDLSLGDLDIEGVKVQRATASIAGDLKSHTILIKGKTGTETLSLRGVGSSPDQKNWQGAIDGIRYEHVLYGSWRQQGRALINASAAGGKIDNLCLSSGANSLCAGGSWDTSGEWTFEAANLHLDLGKLHQWQLFSAPVSGLLAGRLTASGNNFLVREGSGRIEIPEFSMKIDQELLNQDFRWYDTALTFDLADKHLQTRLVSRFVDGSTVNSVLQVVTSGDLSEPISGLPVQGTVQLDLKDLSPLASLTADYLIPSGYLTADIAVNGVLGNPSITGDVALRDGELRFPNLGISLKEVSGDLRGDGRRANIAVQALSGEGRASASGELDFSGEKWRGSFAVTGKNVELMNQRELSIVADPAVELVIGPDGGSLSGNVVVSKALISPEEMKNSDAVSDDVVFVDDKGDVSAWPFTYRIGVELGDDVRVEGYGLNSRLRGKIDVKQAPDGSILGRGEMNTYQGSFSIYNRSIDLSRGRILFDGGPIGNPGLDISARKIIKSDRAGLQDIVVGIDVTGTVHDHKVELFSSPYMEDREIVAYILLDRSFAASDGDSQGIVDAAVSLISSGESTELLGGVANILPVDTVQFAGGIGADDPSLVVGKNLTENLSVGYDFNLFKNKGFFKVRYDFGRGFSIESRNSVEANGVELLYSFER